MPNGQKINSIQLTEMKIQLKTDIYSLPENAHVSGEHCMHERKKYTNKSLPVYQCNSVQLYTLENLIYNLMKRLHHWYLQTGVALEAHQSRQKMSSIVLAYHGPYTQT